ncbi:MULTISPECIES: dienelactone hydrolase family protein [Acinetobacter]|jgi:dienelactone hydrolase|uniref:Dienelactone hydrolase family protein n=1 Tax=Acinetobacter johnsonii TaxID=40214 RepID=A0AAJ6IHQ9_ACIJO|nr:MULTISPECIES: dienelactone hydrolase family protein [Acinetobacter]OHC23138.1 MAG: dienelactone hydrolase [Pseudomonadales bacterium RIFCSPHIGHO2_12_FULL_40_16]ALV71506.1 dienelactone hydrolase [Acinetobacter johnsonii XBB1]MBL8283639.1 dienelactone hydrolase family protein [Acinetobacter johnsonii]MCF7641091.1 dienelactone hydrolase family protein [Acinetobacter johnsonii]MDH1533317.1 dienelactone hydrolase family protein [Acinetobacter johnsonii]
MTISIQTREIQYNAADGQRLVGYFAAPSSQTPHAGIIVAPEWWGRNEYTEQRARELAEHGYAALAIDMYGDKNVTTDAKQAYEWMMQTFADADTIVNRAKAGLDTLAAQPEVNADQLAAIGFCYGGKVVLDLARSGAPLKAVATFHATLAPKAPAVEGQIQGEILVLHGELDSMVTLDDVASFREEMHAAKVDHEVIIFEDAKHGFSNPLADERAKANGVDLGYNLEAERQGLDAMYDLLERNLSA